MNFLTRNGTGDADVIDSIWTRMVYVQRGYPIGPGDVVVDIGAHIGAFAIWAAESGASKVVAFEPDPDNYAMLCRNIQGSGCGNIEAHNVAVGATSGPLTLFLKNYVPTMNTTIVPKNLENYSQITVNAVSLGEAVRIAGGHVDWLKCDAEGAEYAIFTGTDAETLACIEKIGLEWHFNTSGMLALSMFLTWNHFDIDAVSAELDRKEDGSFMERGKMYAKRNDAKATMQAMAPLVPEGMLERIAGMGAVMNARAAQANWSALAA